MEYVADLSILFLLLMLDAGVLALGLYWVWKAWRAFTRWYNK